MNGLYSDIVLKDSSIYVAAPLNINSKFGEYILRLKTDGTIDTSFHHFSLDEFGCAEFCMRFNGKNIIINNSSMNGNKYGLSELDSAGNLIGAYSPEVGRYGVIYFGDCFNRKLLIAGDFIIINGVETYGIACLNLDGSVDSSFVLNKNMGVLRQVKIEDENNILVSTYKNFFKLNSQAEIQTDFNFQHFKTLYQIIKFILLDNGKIMVCDPNNIYRLNSDGSEDTTFDIGTGISGGVSSAFDFDLQGDKTVDGSIFNEFNGTSVNRLVRLNTDASIDTSFNIGGGPDDAVFMIKVLKDSDIIIGGSFKHFDGVSVPLGIVKLSKNGSINIPFNNNQESSSIGFVELLMSKVEQIDTMIYIKGPSSLTALSTNGIFDNNFNIPYILVNVNDIIGVLDTSNVQVGKKAAQSSNKKAYLFVLGTFKKSENEDPSFIVKLDIGRINDSTNTTKIMKIKNLTGFDVFPNPVSDILKIKSSKPVNNYNVELFNINGEKVHESYFKNYAVNSTVELNVSYLLPGMYFLKLTTGSGITMSQKFIKTK